MKKINIFYWICTGLLIAMVGVGSVLDAISYPDSVKMVTGLGYPAYLVPFLGIAKLLAFTVILVPGYHRLKEWAYAGIAFDILGALYSNIVLGKPFPALIFIIMPILLLVGSYVFYHKRSAADNPILVKN
ncbi:DoxX-like family protein [Mucilaginibacter lappiensis]|uniref:Membrane protein n=1 Tax=Mucilaginibacter lappiensis TaxID=354630 RepID=A0ABR6PPG6_9SPHI|nr:DoxX family protein [Mucilaginibacter lappiensis]MBB6111663.1 putative membrane protein [Mucilaginibacter lappiensis]SIR83655.1 DoxX-like family protein [Mucilaginibacter lappiensis]